MRGEPPPSVWMRGVTVMQAVVSVVGLVSVLGGAAYGLTARVDRCEWWIAEHTRTSVQLEQRIAAVDELKIEVVRLREQVSALRDELRRRGRL